MITYTTANQNDRTQERGNVLFLILIAVALFAALSYAVTQSTRSGSGDAGRETNLVNAASITQYPASIKTAITRMIISNGTTADELLFSLPASFTADLTTTTLRTRAVFHPEGGGATYTEAPAAVMASGAPGTWFFNGDNGVANIGTSGAVTVANADIIAFLPGIRQNVCESIHTRLGLSTAIPDLNALAILTSVNMDFADQNIDAGGAQITDAILDGQAQGCFQKPTGTYVYFHALVER